MLSRLRKWITDNKQGGFTECEQDKNKVFFAIDMFIKWQLQQ